MSELLSTAHPCPACRGDMYHYAGCPIGEHGSREAAAVPPGGDEPGKWNWPEEWPAAVKLAAGDLYHCRFPRSGARITAIAALMRAAALGSPNEEREKAAYLRGIEAAARRVRQVSVGEAIAAEILKVGESGPP